MQNGATEPFRCIMEDDTIAVIKVFNNVQGNLSLVNEYICYELAVKLELPMPQSGICICDEHTVDSQKELKSENWGLGFFSTYLEKNALLKLGIMKYVNNIDIFYKLVIFDHLVYNKDRNIGNLLVEYSKNKINISVIDHSHVFKNEAIWNANCFKIGMRESDYLDDEIMASNDALYSMFYHTISITYEKLVDCAKKIAPLITEELLDKIFESVPKQWGTKKEDMLALKEYIIYRVAHLEDMCKVIVNYIRDCEEV